MAAAEVHTSRFREVLGLYPTGVVVVTAFDRSASPIGMTLGTFGSVSLDPPLIGFMPRVGSQSWAALEEAGTGFCVNMLAADQEHVCRAVAARRTRTFAGIPLDVSPAGHPLVRGCVAYVDGELRQKHVAGDHFIVVADVVGLATVGAGPPLAFHAGGYGSYRANAVEEAVHPEVANLVHLPTWAGWEAD